MWKKNGKFYADWTDEHGKRHRKALPTEAQAKKYQRVASAEAAVKKAQPPPRSGTLRRSGKSKTLQIAASA